MGKYIIELDDDIKYLIINGRADNRCYTLVRPVAELEILNSDYINEHYGELQDEAYQKGFEDGKNSIDMGCEGCKYTLRFANDEPCKSCSNCYKSKYEPMPKEDDRIEVGDIVRSNEFKDIAVCVTYVDEEWDQFSGIVITDTKVSRRGHTYASRSRNGWHKTGERFNIEQLWKGES